MAELCVRGVRFRISFGFLTVLAVLCLSGQNFSLYFLACLVHELGHLFCMALLGVRPACITFGAGGILITPRRDRLLPLQKELLILLSGAAVNFLLSALFRQISLTGAAAVQFLVGVWNLLPASSLDGGAVLRCTAEHLTRGKGAQRIIGPLSGVIFLFLAFICWKYRIGGALLCAVFVWFGGTELAKGVGM